MAAIRETLTLADQFSATLNRYLSLLQRSASAGRAAADSQKGMETAAKGAGGALEQMARSAEGTAQSMEDAGRHTQRLVDSCDRASAAQERVNGKMRQGAGAADSLMRKILGLAGAYVSLRGVQAFAGLADAHTQTAARLERMNDGLQTTAELQDLIYQSAQRSRGAYQETADMVGKLGTMAGEAFSSNRELVAFAEQLNKQFALAGTGAQGIQAAMLQLTQAMSSGVLRGEELNSVLEQAPTIAQTIARHMGVTVGEMRELASQGRITSQVVKEALLGAAAETDAAFERVPLTFSQAWTMAGNAAVKSMEPALERLNGLLNSALGQRAVNGLIAGLEMLGGAAVSGIDLLAGGAQWVADNWDLVSAVLQFAGGAMLAFAAVSVASALASAGAWAIAHLPLLLLAALIGAAIVAMYAAGMTSEEVGAHIGGVLGGLYAFGYNLVAAGWNLIAAFAEFFANVFDNPVTAIANLFLGLFNFIMDVVSNAAGAIDALLGSNISGAVRGFQNNVNDFVKGIFGENENKVERMTPIQYEDAIRDFSQAGAGMGRALDNFQLNDILGGFTGGGGDFSGMLNASSIPDSLEAIKGDTGAIKRSVALSEEDRKLFVDMAERQYVNKVNLTAQTPVITINGQNTGDTAEDLQWLENALQRILLEQAASHTDLSYQ